MVSVSDHAVLRFLERVHGYDIENIRGQIISKTVLETLPVEGDYDIKSACGHYRVRVRDGVAVTVLLTQKGKEARGRRKWRSN